MAKYHGIIFAYKDAPELGDLTRERTVASLPFCGRYRLIDFALSSMKNAGITDVGVIMARDYQSLLDHIGSGKDWDMSRRSGGLRMLPPFGLPHAHTGNYAGTIEALNAVRSYILDVPQQHIVLMLGSLIANIDLAAAIAAYESGGTDITAICSDGPAVGVNHHYRVDEDGMVKEIFLYRGDADKGLKSLEGYIVCKDVLLRLMDEAAARNHYAFHRHALLGFLNDGGRMNVYRHEGYVCAVRNIAQYYKASMDMLDAEIRHQIFPASRPVRTKIHEEVSSYFGESAVVKTVWSPTTASSRANSKTASFSPAAASAPTPGSATPSSCAALPSASIRSWTTSSPTSMPAFPTARSSKATQSCPRLFPRAQISEHPSPDYRAEECPEFPDIPPPHANIAARHHNLLSQGGPSVMDTRTSKENYYLDIADSVLERSTCLRRKYGAIIVRNDEIISTGYNGAPRGRKNCSDLGVCTRETLHIPSGERYELCRSVHAEANAIISASRRDMIGATIYLVGRDARTNTLLSDAMSCSMCKRQIINAGIEQVIIRTSPTEFRTIPVSDWVENDDSIFLL